MGLLFTWSVLGNKSAGKVELGYDCLLQNTCHLQKDVDQKGDVKEGNSINKPEHFLNEDSKKYDSIFCTLLENM